jgi:dTDP-4-amino-4,6-dideoxygalactose transaminase
MGLAHAVGVGNGTDALELALRTLGLGPGSRVATVSLTAVATVAAIELAGAEPVLLDIAPETFTLDLAALEAVAPTLQAVIPVHLYGHPVAMPALMALAERHGLKVIEDCAQAHGAALDGKLAGTWGHMAAYSFYPTKNLGAIGDGGAVATNDPALAERARMLREYGWKERYVSDVPGMNTRLDELQAAILRAKLPHLAAENERRRAIAKIYDGIEVGGSDLVLPRAAAGARHVFHQYVVRTPRRDELKAFLAERGIGTLVHYPQPVHVQPAYRGRLAPEGLPRTERACQEVLSLPMFPQLTDEQAHQVREAVSTWAARR